MKSISRLPGGLLPEKAFAHIIHNNKTINVLFVYQ